MQPYKFVFIFLIVVLLASSLSACSGNSTRTMSMASLDQMPAEVQTAPTVVQQAYQFAAANPDVMQHIPCYCGCGNIGHTSNYSCYVSGVDDQAHITFDNHALGCSICVDITQDVMRFLKEGKSPQEARSYIDANYSKFGPSNIP